MAVTYFMKAVPHQFAGWAPDLLTLLDTDGYGLLATDETKAQEVEQAIKTYGLDADVPAPRFP